MALLHESVDFKKLDVRLVERHIARGVIAQNDFDKALKALPDDSENAEWVTIDSLVGDQEDQLATTGSLANGHLANGKDTHH